MQQGRLALALLPGVDDQLSTDPAASAMTVCHQQQSGGSDPTISLIVGGALEVSEALLSPPRTLFGNAAYSAVLPKSDPRVKTSYLMAPVTARNAASMLTWAQRGGFRYVLIPVSAWAATYGSYEINPSNFPGGLSQLTAIVQTARRMGITIGLHTLTALVSKDDPMAKTNADWLLGASATLARPMSFNDVSAEANADVFRAPFSDGPAPNVRDVAAGTEIMECRVSVTSNQVSLNDCRRGLLGTRAELHPTGTRLRVLADRYGSFVADLRSPMRDQIATKLSGILRATGAGMVYFDGGEAGSLNGDPQYFAAEQQIAVLKKSSGPLLVEGSVLVARLWPYIDRVPADDFAALDSVDYLDLHKIGEAYRHLAENLMPGQLGWIGLLPATPAYAATNVEEISTDMARSVGLGVPFSIETTDANIASNPYASRLFDAFAAANNAVSRGTVSGADRQQLGSGIWYYVRDPRPALARVTQQKSLDVAPAARVQASVVLPSSARSVYLRIRDVARTAGSGEAEQTLPLLPNARQALVTLVQPAASKTEAGGTLAGNIDLTPPTQSATGAAGTPALPRDFSESRRMVVDYEFQPPQTTGNAAQPCAVLDLQLVDSRGLFRDYLLDVHQGTQRTTLDFEDAPPRLMKELRPSGGIADLKRSLYTFDFSKIVGVQLRWLRTCSPGSTLVIKRVAMLRESAGDLLNLSVRIGSNSVLSLPQLKSGEILDVFPDGSASICSGASCRSADSRLTMLGAIGGQTLSVSAEGGAGFRLEMGSLGSSVPLTSQ